MTTTDKAETIQIGDVIMPPERELRLWMRKHIATHGLHEAALYLNVTGIYQSTDKGGAWLHFKTRYADIWPGGSYAFTFKARPNTPWQIVERAKTHWEPLLGEVTDAQCEEATEAYYSEEVAQ